MSEEDRVEERRVPRAATPKRVKGASYRRNKKIINYQRRFRKPSPGRPADTYYTRACTGPPPRPGGGNERRGMRAVARGCGILFRALGVLSTAKNFHKTVILYLRRERRTSRRGARRGEASRRRPASLAGKPPLHPTGPSPRRRGLQPVTP